MWPARTDSPRNMRPSNVPMTTRVERALRHSGLRKAGTPFEIASTPVTAAPPEAKACNTTKNDAPMRIPSPSRPRLMIPSSACDAVGSPPVARRASPSPSSTIMFPMKK
jgi:hypothetical protein